MIMNDNSLTSTMALDDVLTVREVSTYLKIAESTVYKLAQSGKLPGRKIGGNWRFSRQALLDWLSEV